MTIDKIIDTYVQIDSRKAVEIFIESDYSFTDMLLSEKYQKLHPDCINLLSDAYDYLRENHYTRVKTFGELSNGK